MKMEIIGDLLEQLKVSYPKIDIGNVHINEMPLQVKHGTLLMDTFAGTSIDQYIPNLRFAGLRLVMRSNSYKRGTLACLRLTQGLQGFTGKVKGKYLHGLFDQDIEITVKNVSVMNEPKPYRSSDGGYVEFELDLELIYLVPDDLGERLIQS